MSIKKNKLLLTLAMSLVSQMSLADILYVKYYFLFDGGKIYCNIDNEQEKTVIVNSRSTYYNPRWGGGFNEGGSFRIYQELNKSVITLPEQVELIRCEAWGNYGGPFGKYAEKPAGTFKISQIASNAFDKCDDLEEITLPSSVKILNSKAFENLKSLKVINLPSSMTRIEISSAFKGCEKLKEINVGEDTANHDAAFSSFDGILCINRQIVLVPPAFSKKTVTIPAMVKSIGAGVFSNRKHIVSANIQGKLSIGDKAFMNCDNLRDFNFENVTDVIGESAFENCTSLENITFGQSLTTIKKRAFYNCELVGSVAFNEGLKDIGTSAFENCASIGVITLPKSLNYIGQDGFKNCSAMARIQLPATGNQLTSIPDGAFSFCSNLKEIKLPSGIKRIGTNAFLGCTALERVTLNADLETINRYAFMGCSNLTSINIPPMTTTFEESFLECPKIKR